ncbi:MAG: DUF547 domain-containing protein [Xanthomonadaceae bacterium]|nr:DUF547 domain-containing protein [Xanthomonadaceae bacterium]
MLVLFFALTSFAKNPLKPTEALNYDPNFTHVARLYKQFVVVTKEHHTQVKYSEIKSNPEQLRAATQSLSDVTDVIYSRMSIDEKTAFYINAFNVFMIQAVVDHYPMKKALDPKAWFSSPLKDKFFTLLGKPQSLDGIRNDILRYEFKNPKILFALCEGSVDGPDLNPEPYLGSHIHVQLDDAEKRFMKDPLRASYDGDKKRFKISKYLKRYNKDFEESYMMLKTYLAKLLARSPKEQMEMQDQRIVTEFYEWNDSLNDKP